jgi:cell wall-associated NlpC family hydrolase
MNWLIEYAIKHCGIPYKWGGSNPISGFDCSGFAQWMLRAAGIDPSGDQTAQALYDHFDKSGALSTIQAGALVFYGESVTKITHVAFAISPYQIIGASGGDRLTMTRDDAAARNACVRMDHIDYRKDRVAVLYPSYARIGLI